MKLVLYVFDKNSKPLKIKNFIPEGYTLLEKEFGQQSIRFLQKISLGFVLVDISSHKALPWVEKACAKRPDLTYLAVGNEEMCDGLPEDSFYDYVFEPFSPGKVKKIFDRAWERARLYYDVSGSRKKAVLDGVNNSFYSNSVTISNNCKGNNNYSRNVTPALSSDYPPKSLHYLTHAVQNERILSDFSRALGSNFNSERLLELFIDSVVGLVPAAKLSILLKEKADDSRSDYLIFAQRGLDPHLYSGLRFSPSGGIISWLAGEGRIFIAGETSDPGSPPPAEALQELEMLQAVVSIPLIAQGELLGALNLGPKVTGAPFLAAELELLFIICGNVALALRDIDLHHRAINQKLYFESILQRMNGGVVAIDCENRIITFNPRAAELLQLEKAEIIGRDLRYLPSPLGDLLYETLVTGREITKEEIELAKSRTPLEINTFQLFDPAGKVLGSVIIFDDISDKKQLEAERRQADQLDVLNKFVSQLAHEIKNPMVAIQTFAELLKDKYDDSSFREYFTYTVHQEIKRLNELVEQLIAFSAPISYKYTVADIHEILDLGLLLLQEQGMGRETTVETSYYKESINVKADKTLLSRAFSYLFRRSFKALEKGGTIQINTSFEKNLFTNGGVCISLCDFQTTADENDLEKIFDPLSVRLNGYISLELPVCRKIIEDHGGSIKALRRKNKNLEFEVLLPVFSGGGEDVE